MKKAPQATREICKNDAVDKPHWRITEIYFTKGHPPFELKAFLLSLVCLLGIGLGALDLATKQILSMAGGIVLTVGSVLGLALRTSLDTGKEKAQWLVMKGKCLDREIKQCLIRVHRSEGAGDDVLVWQSRLVCEYEYEGNKYRFIPETKNCSSREDVEAYVDAHVDESGDCYFFVNFRQLLEAKLISKEDAQLKKASHKSNF